MILILTIAFILAPGVSLGQGTAATDSPKDYLVGPEDVLSITVYGESQLTGKYRVDADGSFPFQYLGRVKADGLTTAAVEAALRKGLSDGFLRNPQVSVEVDQYRSQSVFVTGEVRSPNKYLLPGNSTLMDVINLAGSVTSSAGSWVEIRHSRRTAASGSATDQGLADIRVKLTDVQTGKAHHIRVLDGDTIYIPKAERIFVVGEVRNPGAFTYDEGMTVFQAVSLAGGANEKGSNRYSIRRLIRGEMKEIDAKAEDKLLGGDQVNVKRRRL